MNFENRQAQRVRRKLDTGAIRVFPVVRHRRAALLPDRVTAAGAGATPFPVAGNARSCAPGGHALMASRKKGRSQSSKPRAKKKAAQKKTTRKRTPAKKKAAAKKAGTKRAPGKRTATKKTAKRKSALQPADAPSGTNPLSALARAFAAHRLR